jgi:hypothetical protein
VNERDSSAPAPGPTGAPSGADQVGAGRGLATALILYTVARLGLVVVLAAIIYGVGHLAGVDVPILVAAIFAVVIALPLGMLLFKRLRTDVNSAISAVDADRRAKRDALQARLQGSQRPDGSGDPRS